MPMTARRILLVVAACAAAWLRPGSMAAQDIPLPPLRDPGRAPEDTAAFRWLDNGRKWILWDTTAIPLTWLNSLANGYLHPRRDTLAQKWRTGVIFNPLFGGQQSIGFELG